MAEEITEGEMSTRFTRGLEKRVLLFIQQAGVLRSGKQVVVGVSGGPDSTALALILARLQGKLDIQLSLAHFDHMLRGRDSADEDRRYVCSLAEKLGLAVFWARGDVKAYARDKGLSLEEAGRELRYKFFEAEAERLGADLVALGHTASDQAETVLMHIIRGSGIDGLVGMRPRSAWPWLQGPDVARPLLGVWRQDTERYCQELGLSPRRDPSNEQLEATRNRVRLQLIPLLKEINPGIEKALVRLSAAASGYMDYLDRQADTLWGMLAREADHSVRLSRWSLAELAPPLAERLLRQAARRLGVELEAVHLQAMMEGLQAGRARLSLPRGLVFKVAGKEAGIFSGMATMEVKPIPETVLAIPGCTELPGWTVEAKMIPRPRDIRKAGPCEAFFDPEIVAGGMTVRSRRPGDRLRPLGLGGEKKVQDILVDGKVAVEARNGVPIVCVPWGVAWVVGHCIDERAAIKRETPQVLWVRFSRGENAPGLDSTAL